MEAEQATFHNKDKAVVEIDHTNTITAEDREFLDFKLTDRELLDYGRLNSQKHREIKKLENEKKDAADHFKNLIGGVQAEIDRMNSLIETEVESREVDCLVKRDYGNRKIHFIHDGVVMKTQEMPDYIFDQRPSHILPEKKEEEKEEVIDATGENMTEDEVQTRQQEIATKEAANQVPSADVKMTTEAKTEESVLNSAVMAQ